MIIASSVHASNRVALLIANQDYTNGENDLKNPVNDANLIASKLKDLDFDVTVVKNGDRVAMHRAIDNFGQQSRNAESAVFYYSGHGMQNKYSQNFLIPVDANIKSDDSISYSAVNIQKIINKLDEANPQVSLVMLDACRNNKFLGTKGSKNFAVVGYKTESDGEMLVSYATKSGEISLDGKGKNSPYAIAIAEQLTSANKSPLELIFHHVRNQVKETTGNEQSPTTEGDMGYYTRLFGGSSPVNYPVSPQPRQTTQQPTQPVTNTNSNGERIGKYIAYANGTALDTETNMMWARCSVGQTWNGASCNGEAKLYSWEEAFTAIKQLNKENYLGYNDWQLPHVQDLHSLIYCSKGFQNKTTIPSKANGTIKVRDWCNSGSSMPTINQSVFSSKKFIYWSALPDAGNSDYAWSVDFYDGNANGHGKYDRTHVRAARSMN